MLINNEEIFVIEYLNDTKKRVIYAPLRSYLALVSESAANHIVKKSPSLIKEQFINRLKQRGVLDMQRVISELHSANPELSIAVTDNCNMRCVYCHASAGDPGKEKTMSYKMIDKIIEKYFQAIQKTNAVQIGFNGGGEPTYNFNKFKYAVNKIKGCAGSKGIKYKLSMATNGNYGDKVREFISNEFDEISLSFDGPAHIQNLHRPNKDGNGSFSRVFATAKYFYNIGFNIAFRATISNYSIKHLEEIIDFFEENFPGTSIGMEILNPLGRGAYCNIVSAPSEDEFSKGIIHLLNYIKDKNISIINSASTDYNLIRPVFCTNVGIPSWTVNVDGVIYACHRDDAPDAFIFGKYDVNTDNLILDQEKIDAIRKMVVFNYEECSDCFCKYHCAGDCPDRRLSGNVNCTSTKEIGIKILNDLINNEKKAFYGNSFT